MYTYVYIRYMYSVHTLTQNIPMLSLVKLRDIARFVMPLGMVCCHVAMSRKSPKSLKNLRNRIQRGWKRPDLPCQQIAKWHQL